MSEFRRCGMNGNEDNGSESEKKLLSRRGFLAGMIGAAAAYGVDRAIGGNNEPKIKQVETAKEVVLPAEQILKNLSDCLGLFFTGGYEPWKAEDLTIAEKRKKFLEQHRATLKIFLGDLKKNIQQYFTDSGEKNFSTFLKETKPEKVPEDLAKKAGRPPTQETTFPEFEVSLPNEKRGTIARELQLLEYELSQVGCQGMLYAVFQGHKIEEDDEKTVFFTYRNDQNLLLSERGYYSARVIDFLPTSSDLDLEFELSPVKRRYKKESPGNLPAEATEAWFLKPDNRDAFKNLLDDEAAREQLKIDDSLTWAGASSVLKSVVIRKRLHGETGSDLDVLKQVLKERKADRGSILIGKDTTVIRFYAQFIDPASKQTQSKGEENNRALDSSLGVVNPRYFYGEKSRQAAARMLDAVAESSGRTYVSIHSHGGKDGFFSSERKSKRIKNAYKDEFEVQDIADALTERVLLQFQKNYFSFNAVKNDLVQVTLEMDDCYGYNGVTEKISRLIDENFIDKKYIEKTAVDLGFTREELEKVQKTDWKELKKPRIITHSSPDEVSFAGTEVSTILSEQKFFDTFSAGNPLRVSHLQDYWEPEMMARNFGDPTFSVSSDTRAESLPVGALLPNNAERYV